jgi:ribulose-phosphate 3-epimerase
MVRPVDRLIEDFVEAGATYITFHPEASDHVDRSIQLIKDSGCKAGLVLNPASPVSLLENCLDKLDMILIMSVNPGFGGQEFIPSVKSKIEKLRETLDQKNLKIRLEVDGGVKLENIAEISSAGADTFVSGSGIFGKNDYKKIISKMREKLI